MAVRRRLFGPLKAKKLTAVLRKPSRIKTRDLTSNDLGVFDYPNRRNAEYPSEPLDRVLDVVSLSAGLPRVDS